MAKQECRCISVFLSLYLSNFSEFVSIKLNWKIKKKKENLSVLPSFRLSHQSSSGIHEIVKKLEKHLSSLIYLIPGNFSLIAV